MRNYQILAVAVMMTLVLTACGDDGAVSVAADTEVTAAVTTDAPVGASETTAEPTSVDVTYAIVDTGQIACYSTSGEIPCPQAGEAFYGQDAQYEGSQPLYTDNGDGTVTDNVTGLMWEQAFTQVDWADAEAAAAAATTGGYDDWRIPTIKELYSLIDFTGNQGTGDVTSTVAPDDAVPYIDTDYFEFEYPSNGNRYIDAQYVTSTEYVGTAMDGAEAFFGVNLADGRIKGYLQVTQQSSPRYYARFVRGSSDYGINGYQNNGDGTVIDNATGLVWTTVDSGDAQFAEMLADYTNGDCSLNWEEAPDFAENLTYAGYSDWRLPSAKELHTIVDYRRAPDVTDSPAIDPIFASTAITNEAGEEDYAFYWTSTSFLPGATDAVIIQFGRSLGYMDRGSGEQFYDVHGEGGQRTDLKEGTLSYGHGPQGDVRRVYNYVRVVRDAG